MKIFSVTQVLGIYGPWHRIPANILKMAIDRGVAVHAASETYLKGLFVSIPNEYKGHFLSFKKWFDQYVDYVFFTETRFEDPILKFSGQPDLGCRLKNAMFQSERKPAGYKFPIIDIKTSKVESKTWRGQGAAYHHLCNQVEKKYDCSIFLQTDEKGRPPKVRIYEYLEKDFAAFLSALNAYRYFME